MTTESRGSIGSGSAIPKMPSLKPESEYEQMLKKKAMMQKKYQELDRKAEQFKEGRGRNAKEVRNSKDYSKVFDKISTRYNYQTINGIGGYLEQEREYKLQQSKKMDWTKQAVNITNQLVKDRNTIKRVTPNRMRAVKNNKGFDSNSKEELGSILYHQVDNSRSQSKQRSSINPAINVPVIEMHNIEVRRAGETFTAPDVPKGY
jgi:hypothetical protein